MLTYSYSYYDVQNTRLHVVEAGPADGPALVFLHGFPEFWYGWHRQIRYFAERGWRVIVPDQRGYNLSEKPQGIGAYRLDILAGDILTLLDQIGVAKAVVVGHDWGGVVAWWLGLNHGDRLDRLVILNAPHPSVMRRALLHNRRQRRKSWYVFYYQLPFLPERKLSGENWKVLTAAIQKTSLPGTFDEEDLRKYHQAWAQPGAIKSMLNWYRASLRRTPPRPKSVQVTVPVLCIWGVKDRFLGIELAEESVARCTNGRLVTIDEATHWVQHEQADRVNAEIENFCSDE